MIFKEAVARVFNKLESVFPANLQCGRYYREVQRWTEVLNLFLMSQEQGPLPPRHPHPIISSNMTPLALEGVYYHHVSPLLPILFTSTPTLVLQSAIINALALLFSINDIRSIRALSSDFGRKKS